MIRLKSEGNRLFRLEVRDPDPAQAHRLAKFVLDRFVTEYRASQTATNTSTRDFLARQLEVYQADLQTAENELNAYQAGLASAALVDNPVNALNIGTADAALTALRLRFDGQDAAELRDLSQSARNVTGELPPLSTYQGDGGIVAAVSELEDLEFQSRLVATGDRDARDLETRLGQLRVRLRALVDSQVALQQPSLSFLSRNQVAEFVYFSLYRQGMAEVIRRLDSGIRGFRNFTARQPQQSTRVAELQSEVDARAQAGRVDRGRDHAAQPERAGQPVGDRRPDPHPPGAAAGTGAGRAEQAEADADGRDPVAGHRAGSGRSWRSCSTARSATSRAWRRCWA